MQTRLALGAMTVVTFLWAANFTAGKVATAEIHWAAIAGIRIVVTAFVFALFLPRGTLAATRWRAVLPLAFTGIVLNQLFFAWGIRLTTPGHSSIIHALIPAVVAAMSAAFLGTRFGARALAGVALAVGGASALALLGPSNGADARNVLLGDGLTFLGAAAFSAYIVLGRHAVATEGPFATVARAFAGSVPFAIPMLVYGALNTSWSAVTWRGWSALAFMIVGATFICYTLHMWSLARLDALKVAVFTDVQPILAAVIAQTMGLEKITVQAAVAAAIVIAGVALVQIGGPVARRETAPA